MDDALFGPDPAQLAVVDKMAPGCAPVCDEGVEGAACDAACEVGDGEADDFVAAANREGLRPLVSWLDWLCGVRSRRRPRAWRWKHGEWEMEGRKTTVRILCE